MKQIWVKNSAQLILISFNMSEINDSAKLLLFFNEV